MSGVHFLTLASLILILIARGRITSPFYCVGIFPLMYLCGKYYWNHYWQIDFLRDCSEREISHVCLLLGLSLLGAAILARVLQHAGMPRLLKLDAYLQRNRMHSHEFVWGPTSHRFIALVVASIIALFLWARVFKGVDFVNNTLAMRRLMQGQGAAYLMLVANLLVAMTAVFATCSSVTRRYGWMRWVLPLGLCAVYALFSGFASSIFSIALVVVNCVALRNRLRLWWLPILLFPAIVYFAFMHNLVRQSKTNDPSASVVSILDAMPAWRDIAPHIFNRLDYLEMMALGYRELVKQPPEGIRPLAEVLVQPVPRAIWPEKPLNFSTAMSWRVMPEVVSEVGSTANYNAFNEFVRAFGPALGLVVFVVILALVLVWADYFHVRAQENAQVALFYICVVNPYLAVGFIAGFVNDLALPNLLISSLVLLTLQRARIIPNETVTVSVARNSSSLAWLWRVFFPKASSSRPHRTGDAY